jgi:putative ABC transport system permease protein
MIGSYIATALRRLFAEKLYAAINVAGLAVGLACSILILLFVRYETSFDRHWPDAERIYRISADVDPLDGRVGAYLAANVRPAAPFLAEDFAAEIEQTAQITAARVRLRIRDAVRYEDDFRFASATFFDVFKADWVQGDAARALAEPASVVLTESAAAQYFGTADPIGQTLVVEDQWPITVTGIIRDLPPDTHLSGAAFASFDVFSRTLGPFDYSTDNWSFSIFHTYVRLRPGARIESLESRFADFVARHRRPNDRVSGMSATAVADVHLHGRAGELRPSGSPTLMTTFGAIAACILLIACVNFTNLATARGVQRAREVGVRKVLGAARGELVAQFLGEATIYAAIALLFALVLVELLLPAFNAFLGTPLLIDYFGDTRVVAGLLALVPIVGLLAGSYPALYLSAFEPARVLRGDVTRGKGGHALRGTLVVAQFAISIALLIVTTVVYLQTDFARNIDRGFRTDQIVILSGSENSGVGQNWPALRQRLLEHPEITEVITGSMLPNDAGERHVRAEGGDPAGRQISTRGVDYGFFETTTSTSSPAGRSRPSAARTCSCGRTARARTRRAPTCSTSSRRASSVGHPARRSVSGSKSTSRPPTISERVSAARSSASWRTRTSRPRASRCGLSSISQPRTHGRKPRTRSSTTQRCA